MALLFCKLLAGEKKIRISVIFKKTIYLVVICVCLVCSLFATRKYTQTLVGNMISETMDLKNNADNIILTDKSVEYDKKTTKEGKNEVTEKSNMTIGRKKGVNGYNDVSSGRIELWKQGTTLFLRHPIMGISRANFLYYGDVYLKDGLRFPDVHNGYLSILIAYGLSGFLWFVLFGISVAVSVLRHLFRQSVLHKANVFPKLFSFIVAYCVYALIEITFLSQPFFETLIFWFVLGYIMTCVKKYSDK